LEESSVDVLHSASAGLLLMRPALLGCLKLPFFDLVPLHSIQITSVRHDTLQVQIPSVHLWASAAAHLLGCPNALLLAATVPFGMAATS
jgi:hypothetical protein